MEAIFRGVAGGTIASVKVASEAGQALSKIAPQILKGLGYAAGGVATAVDLGFLIHTCVTFDDVPHAEALRSLSDQMDEMDIESVTKYTVYYYSVDLMKSNFLLISIIG